MKTILTTVAALAFVILGSAPQAEARGHSKHRTTVYVSGYQSCGTPIYRERYVVRYQRCGTPVWATRPCRAPYRPVRRAAYRPVRPAYVAPCPPPRPVRYARPGFHGQIVLTR